LNSSVNWGLTIDFMALARKIYIFPNLTKIMTRHHPVKTYSPPNTGKHWEDGIEKSIVKNYIYVLVPQILVFFSIQNVGLRALRYFCEEVLHFPISIPAIQRVICHAGKRAKQKLAALDLKAGEFASVMYMDTTWKGLFAKFFAAIAREGNYLFCLEPVKKESAAAVQPHLRRLAEVCHNLRLIVTDMALGFEKAIPRIFRGVIHLFCHNHMLKAVDRVMPEARKDFREAKKKLAKSKKPAKTVQKWLGKGRKHLYNARSYRKKLQKEKVKICQEHEIPVKPNGASKAPKKGMPPFLRKLSGRINKAQVKESRYKRQTSKQLAKRAKAGEAVETARKGYFKQWHKYAADRQIFAQFKLLLRATTLREFVRLRLQLQRRIAHSPSKVAAKVGEYLRSPKLTRYFRFPEEERAALGPINTNRVEGFFAQMRVTLDGLRNAPDTPYVRARLVLLRYWHNVVGPLSGPNAGISPCRQLGIRLRPGNPIQAICEGAPLPKNIPDFCSWPAGAAGVRA